MGITEFIDELAVLQCHRCLAAQQSQRFDAASSGRVSHVRDGAHRDKRVFVIGHDESDQCSEPTLGNRQVLGQFGVSLIDEHLGLYEVDLTEGTAGLAWFGK